MFVSFQLKLNPFMAKLGRLMHLNMGRVDDDVVSMVVVIPNGNHNGDNEKETRNRNVEVGLTFGVLEQFHFFSFSPKGPNELNNGK